MRRFWLVTLCGWSWLRVGGAIPITGTFETGKPASKHARVVVVANPQALHSFDPRLAIIRQMVADGVMALSRKPTEAAAWRSFVSTQDVVGIKVVSAPGPIGGTRPAVVASVIEGLLGAGLPPQQIVVWDKQTRDLRAAGYDQLAARYGVAVAASVSAGYDPNVAYSTALIGQLVWGDREFGQTGAGIGRKSYVTRLLTHRITKIISITPLLNHNSVGVTGNLYSLALGSVDNTLRFANDPDRLATAVPEIFALPAISDKLALCLVDALICQYEGQSRTLLQYSTALNQLRFSTDAVALDVLSIRELARQRRLVGIQPMKTNLDLYQNATLLELGASDPANIDVETVR